MGKRLRLSLNTIGAFLVVISLIHWFPMGINVLELMGAFAHLTLFLAVIIFLACLFYQKWIGALFSLVAVVLCGVLTLPHFSTFSSTETADLSIGQFNMYYGNTQPTKAFLTLKETTADLLVIQEQSIHWESIIDSVLGETHPFSTTRPWQDCCYGIGFYSKFPILESEIFEMEGTPAIRAVVDVNGKKLTIITLHTRPPVFPNMTKERNQQLEMVAEMALQITGPLIVIGDLNVVPWDDAFKTFLHNGNLQAVRNGLQATFPMELGIPLIPIDHITYSGPLIPTSCEAVTIPGSDHRGLMAGFKFNDQ